MSAALAAFVIVGLEVFAGAPTVDETIPDWFEGTLVAPVAFAARTTPRSRSPTSAEVTTYDDATAPLMFVQLAPEAEHRCHWYV